MDEANYAKLNRLIKINKNLVTKFRCHQFHIKTVYYRLTLWVKLLN